VLRPESLVVTLRGLISKAQCHLVKASESGSASARCAVRSRCISTGDRGGDSEGSGIRYVFCPWATLDSANLL
jgi:hypothetical protein